MAHQIQCRQMSLYESDKSFILLTKHPLIKQIVHGYLLHNQVLENVSSAKYLGVQITDDLDWSQHIDEH